MQESKSNRVRIVGEDDPNPRKTHLVIDKVLYEDEGGGSCYVGTHKDCIQWVNMQGYFGYEIVPMTEEELKLYNDGRPKN